MSNPLQIRLLNSITEQDSIFKYLVCQIGYEVAFGVSNNTVWYISSKKYNDMERQSI
jgi:hypothetical protein